MKGTYVYVLYLGEFITSTVLTIYIYNLNGEVLVSRQKKPVFLYFFSFVRLRRIIP